MGPETIWDKAFKMICLEERYRNVITWLKAVKPMAIKNGNFVLLAPNFFTRDWLEKKCKTLILDTVRQIDSSIKNIDLKVAENKNFIRSIDKIKKRELKERGVEIQIGLIDLETDPNTNLNPKYQFENYIVGSFNEMAHACTYSLTDLSNLGKEYNPLFIYGPVGVGKTHLIQALGNSVSKKSGKKLNVLYTTGEIFSNDLVEATKRQKIEEFHKKYRRIDLLIIDDIQFISGKEKTQIEFFHTFNHLYGLDKQIVISSDRSPQAIPALHERLLSRFEGGTVADITYPDYETRLAILKMKCAQQNISVPEEILEYIAVNVQKNIRQLEGALNKIILTIKIKQTVPSLFEAKKLLKQIVYTPKKRVDFSHIINVVAEFYNIDVRALIEGGRLKEYVKPRQICMYLLREELKESFTLIGKRFGGKDHTTVIHAYEKILNQLKEDIELEQEINHIKERLYISK